MFKRFKQKKGVIHEKRFVKFKENPGYEFSGNAPRILISVDAITAVREWNEQLTMIWSGGQYFQVQGSYEEVIKQLGETK